MKIAIIAITRNGALLGQKLRKGLPGSQLFVSSRYAGQAGIDKQTFDPTRLKEQINSLWPENKGFVFIMATGIVVRMIAPLLESKEKDPAVVVMDDAGKFAISLLSGHLGGANELAERCAFSTGARPVITTATDANNLPSFDMLSKEMDWAIDDISRIKTLNSLLLDGEKIAVVDPGGQTRCWFHGRGNLSFYDSFDEAIKSRASGFVFVTNRHLPPQTQPENLLILRPRNLVLGIGCNRGTLAEEIELLVKSKLKTLFLSIKSVACIATAKAKSEEPGLVALAEKLGVPLKCFESDQLNQITVPSPPSQHAFKAIGATGVAEPAALLASDGGNLLLKKVKSENATLAVVEKKG